MEGGIEDRECSTSLSALLANVNPAFNWVRLAQRVNRRGVPTPIGTLSY
jgi:hypothetical protein